jgi:phosphohistidine phosphatase
VTDVRRRLVVVRHAKAEPYGPSDHERRLLPRGRQSALDAGRHLRETGVLPELALVSSATRTRQTWAAVAEALGVQEDLATYHDSLFAGGPDVVLEAVQAVPERLGTVVVVGHNPTVAFLGHLLDDGEGDPDAVTGMLAGFPPGALLLLEVQVPWAQLGPETGRVVDFYVGSA